MILNKENIKIINGITTTEYDNIIDLLIPQLLEGMSFYCNNDFLYYSAGLYIYDDTDLVIDSTTITLDTDLPLIVGDFIRLYGTVYNDSLYQVKSFEGGIITIETSKTMRTETISSAIIAMVKFPNDFLNIISGYIKSNVVNDGNVIKEKIHDTEIQYAGLYSNKDFIQQNKVFMLPYRKAFRENLDIMFGRC